MPIDSNNIEVIDERTFSFTEIPPQPEPIVVVYDVEHLKTDIAVLEESIAQMVAEKNRKIELLTAASAKGVVIE